MINHRWTHKSQNGNANTKHKQKRHHARLSANDLVSVCICLLVFTIEAASGQWGALTYYFLIRARVGSHLDGD